MFWADRIAQEIKDARGTSGAPLIIRDEKTLSGRVHIGSMRGLAIHGVIAEILGEQGVPHQFLWEHNDFDPFDSIPPFLDETTFREHLGKPLYTVPSPEPGFANFAEYFAAEFVSAHIKAGFRPTYYWAYKDLYKAGKMDTLIKIALDRAADVRRILKDVSGSVKDETWLPISVVCEQCGKMMTTRASGWDGEMVAYTCDKGPDGCVPCGKSGRVSPLGGAAKLFWKTDWAAKWVAVEVDVEGGGKDHFTKGGAHDVSAHIAQEIYGYEPPYGIPYEFFLVGGKKMSSSKGRGSSAKEFADLFPSELFRLVLLGKDINQQIEIDPSGDAVPRLYDWYDELAASMRSAAADDYARLYALCQLPENRANISAPWQMPFKQVAFLVQMPHMDLEAEAARLKGSALSAEEVEKLKERAQYAKFWLTTYAPVEFKYELQQEMPTAELSEVQKSALATLARYLEEGAKTGEELHHRLHELKTEVPIKPAELFSAIYSIFLNRTSGPQAGWFLASLPRDFVLKRLAEASK